MGQLRRNTPRIAHPRHLRRRPATAALLLAGLSSVAVWSSTAAGAAKPLPLPARLIERGDFPGFTLEAPKSYTAKAWVTSDTSLGPAQVKAQVARLEREGFKGLLTVYLDDAQGPRNGVFWAMQLGSAASARAELAATVSYEKTSGNAPETFRVKAIPGASGFGGTNGPGSGGENVVFADGSFLYLLGNAWSGSKHNPKHAALIAAATRIFKRVHGHPAG